jgi:uncharacterized membrane protein
MSFFLRKKKRFFAPEQYRLITEAIRAAEQRTSGEVRVFVENRCTYMDALDRAAEIFFNLKMDKTRDRNGVLIYLAVKDRQMAVFGDEGIHQKVGSEFWKQEVQKMISSFNRENYVEGIVQVIRDIGEALQSHFPYDKSTDKNELPDDIVFGT